MARRHSGRHPARAVDRPGTPLAVAVSQQHRLQLADALAAHYPAGPARDDARRRIARDLGAAATIERDDEVDIGSVVVQCRANGRSVLLHVYLVPEQVFESSIRWLGLSGQNDPAVSVGDFVDAAAAVPQRPGDRVPLAAPEGRRVRTGTDERSDAELLDALVAGDQSVFAMLYARHRPIAASLSRIEAGLHGDEVVTEAFTTVFETVRNGNTIDDFRPFLLATIRSIAERNRQGRSRPAGPDGTARAQAPDTAVESPLDSIDLSGYDIRRTERLRLAALAALGSADTPDSVWAPEARQRLNAVVMRLDALARRRSVLELECVWLRHTADASYPVTHELSVAEAELNRLTAAMAAAANELTELGVRAPSRPADRHSDCAALCLQAAMDLGCYGVERPWQSIPSAGMELEYVIDLADGKAVPVYSVESIVDGLAAMESAGGDLPGECALLYIGRGYRSFDGTDGHEVVVVKYRELLIMRDIYNGVTRVLDPAELAGVRRASALVFGTSRLPRHVVNVGIGRDFRAVTGAGSQPPQAAAQDSESAAEGPVDSASASTSGNSAGRGDGNGGGSAVVSASQPDPVGSFAADDDADSLGAKAEALVGLRLSDWPPNVAQVVRDWAVAMAAAHARDGSWWLRVSGAPGALVVQVGVVGSIGRLTLGERAGGYAFGAALGVAAEAGNTVADLVEAAVSGVALLVAADLATVAGMASRELADRMIAAGVDRPGQLTFWARSGGVTLGGTAVDGPGNMVGGFWFGDEGAGLGSGLSVLLGAGEDPAETADYLVQLLTLEWSPEDIDSVSESVQADFSTMAGPAGPDRQLIAMVTAEGGVVLRWSDPAGGPDLALAVMGRGDVGASGVSADRAAARMFAARPAVAAVLDLVSLVEGNVLLTGRPEPPDSWIVEGTAAIGDRQSATFTLRGEPAAEDGSVADVTLHIAPGARPGARRDVVADAVRSLVAAATGDDELASAAAEAASASAIAVSAGAEQEVSWRLQVLRQSDAPVVRGGVNGGAPTWAAGWELRGPAIASAQTLAVLPVGPLLGVSDDARRMVRGLTAFPPMSSAVVAAMVDLVSLVVEGNLVLVSQLAASGGWRIEGEVADAGADGGTQHTSATFTSSDSAAHNDSVERVSLNIAPGANLAGRLPAIREAVRSWATATTGDDDLAAMAARTAPELAVAMSADATRATSWAMRASRESGGTVLHITTTGGVTAYGASLELWARGRIPAVLPIDLRTSRQDFVRRQVLSMVEGLTPDWRGAGLEPAVSDMVRAAFDDSRAAGRPVRFLRVQIDGFRGFRDVTFTVRDSRAAAVVAERTVEERPAAPPSPSAGTEPRSPPGDGNTGPASPGGSSAAAPRHRRARGPRPDRRPGPGRCAGRARGRSGVGGVGGCSGVGRWAARRVAGRGRGVGERRPGEVRGMSAGACRTPLGRGGVRATVSAAADARGGGDPALRRIGRGGQSWPGRRAAGDAAPGRTPDRDSWALGSGWSRPPWNGWTASIIRPWPDANSNSHCTSLKPRRSRGCLSAPTTPTKRWRTDAASPGFPCRRR